MNWCYCVRRRWDADGAQGLLRQGRLFTGILSDDHFPLLLLAPQAQADDHDKEEEEDSQDEDEGDDQPERVAEELQVTAHVFHHLFSATGLLMSRMM